MDKEIEFTMTSVCPSCGAGVNLLEEDTGDYSGVCPLCSTKIRCPAGTERAKEEEE